MLMPRHPQPVARRREVACAVVRQAAAPSIVAPGHVLTIAAPEPPLPPAPPARPREVAGSQ